jgi:hypothetical protein
MVDGHALSWYLANGFSGMRMPMAGMLADQQKYTK